jgi:hypothetical protein
MKLTGQYFLTGFVILSYLFAPMTIKAQTTVVQDAPAIPGTTVVIPGKEYKRSAYHNFFWGRNYRKVWATPVRVNNFYLDTAAGGLIPYKRGGGRQSNTLRLKTKEGQEYVLRSVNKDFGRALPEEMRGTFVSRIAKDQVSIGHPFAGITILPMIEVTGIYHTRPVIVFVPKQPALGEYNDEYGDQLYLFEERPDENQSNAPNFGYSKNVIGSVKLFEHLFEDNDNHVDQAAFVRARLFDMFIGDWGRHPDNWRWAKFEDGKDNIYRPIPRDRDQAYTKVNGLYPSLAGKFYKPLQGFDETVNSERSWNLPARHLDKMLLNGLQRDTWVAQARELEAVLTDSLIEQSIRRMPAEMFAISGNSIIKNLKSRRDHLQEYANDYYKYLAKRVDIIGSQDRELVVINQLPGNETEVNVHKITKEGEVKKAFYSRKFSKNETKEIRIYTLEDRDKVEVRGEPGDGIKIRIIDPDASDSISFEQKALHKKIDIESGNKYEYDTSRQKRYDFSLRPIISSSIYKVFDRNPMKLFPRTGIKIVSSLTYNSEPWRKPAYENVHQICANWGFIRGAFNTGYIGRYGKLVGKWDLVIKARLDLPAVENYFGTGNETKFENKTTNYYSTFSNRAFGSIGLESNFSKFHHLEFSALYQSVKVFRTSDHYISNITSVIDPSVFRRNRFVGVEGGYYYLKMDNDVFPLSGIGYSIGAGFMQNMEEKTNSFGKVLINSVYFIPLTRQFSIALRGGAAGLTGNAQYYNLNSIGGGGGGEMRGYDRERFYGKHSVYGNADLRWLVNTKNFLFNGRIGLLGFYDVGRVWQPGEHSTLWHGSYGGGLILIPYNKYALTISYGVSKEATHINFKTGFFF